MFCSILPKSEYYKNQITYNSQTTTNNKAMQAESSSKNPASKTIRQEKRKEISKVRRKIKNQNTKLVETFKGIESKKGSTLGTFLSDAAMDQNDYDMLNHVSMGSNRKMKKKMKKLSKKFANDGDKVFKGMQTYKREVYERQGKTLFNPVNEMEVRREKRMKRLEANTRRSKNQILQKKQ